MDIKKLKAFFYLGAFYLLISFLLRIVFIFHPITTSSFGFFESIGVILLGMINDIFIFSIASVFLVIYFLFLSNSKYDKPWGYIIFGLLLAFALYIAFVPNNIFKQYGGSVAEIALIFVGLKTILFGLLLFVPNQRVRFRNILYFITLFLYVFLIIQNAVSEYFFWNEFGVRYNFIAVDYLIYTNEVIGNIMESYPVVPLFSVMIAIAILVTIFIYNRTKSELLTLPNFVQKMIFVATYIVLFGLSLFVIGQIKKIHYQNTFSEEIKSNGLEKFYTAFNTKSLDYVQFYPSMGEAQAQTEFLKQFSPSELRRPVVSDHPELRKNVVLISIESLSADFMSHYGNQNNVTPFLDSLATKSMMFTNMYATGNRTVRGLEALTLCIPPTAGESVVKRIDNKNKFTTGSVFKSKDYQVKYLYGGDSYFDNMKDFFGGNNYDIVDRAAFKPNEITFANIWGVSDEDMAEKAVETMNKEAKAGKAFFNHWMTVSNHRPFTYPDGRIDIPGTAKSRDGGVKYTDYSIKKFFEMAKKQDWYKNTIFVIVSDHCASSAGKTELPMDKYRIPAMIFSEGLIEAKQVNTLMSQIDLMPTLFGLMNFNYESQFLGQDIFKPNYQPRAYIATYQDLGLIKNNILTIISPTKKVKQYDLKLQKNDISANFNPYFDEIPRTQIDEKLKNETIATYESTSLWLKNKKLDKTVSK
ncbi:sulfatase-like hydrolase/transferase [Chryseobacterium sp. POL2]|uniref:LTA synthase family protein n=1 Tax=Chryseobacterium sp. POL2 TaxID=2713414 RepID=UPI0013E1BE16|nr:alkaline phosphatase family protein [Chryseobacterium sp. POL2]QIG88932.1 sulfatase-like hydrolase/transferase [Chryseobacterium sp. POL2]